MHDKIWTTERAGLLVVIGCLTLGGIHGPAAHANPGRSLGVEAMRRLPRAPASARRVAPKVRPRPASSLWGKRSPKPAKLGRAFGTLLAVKRRLDQAFIQIFKGTKPALALDPMASHWRGWHRTVLKRLMAKARKGGGRRMETSRIDLNLFYGRKQGTLVRLTIHVNQTPLCIGFVTARQGTFSGPAQHRSSLVKATKTLRWPWALAAQRFTHAIRRGRCKSLPWCGSFRARNRPCPILRKYVGRHPASLVDITGNLYFEVHRKGKGKGKDKDKDKSWLGNVPGTLTVWFGTARLTLGAMTP